MQTLCTYDMRFKLWHNNLLLWHDYRGPKVYYSCSKGFKRNIDVGFMLGQSLVLTMYGKTNFEK